MHNNQTVKIINQIKTKFTYHTFKQVRNGLLYLVQPPPILAPVYKKNPPKNDSNSDTPFACPSVPAALADRYPPIIAPIT